ncbi:ROK family protein [Paraliobacillus salinarum]|uniref:ROK family protein n=1 Tax=Paraliobacillus salinarum TaxID=1158996 RepID=UPI0015F6FA20|nr:ROK family protein [Paraliobacillus salinarum]
MSNVIAFDFGGTKIKHGLINSNGEIITTGAYKTERKDLDRFLTDLFATVRTYQASSDVRGIAISMPGYIDVHTGYSERAGAITALDGKNIKDLLETEFSLPVETENDGNCAALAEGNSGNAQGCESFICMTVGTGIGGCIYLNGDIYRGSNLRAGEYGMMITDLTSGEQKNMHQTAGFSNLVTDYKRYMQTDENVEGTAIFEAALNDPHVKKMIDDWVGHISRGIFNLCVTLNPEKILIGGGVSAQSYLFETINRQLKQYHYWHEFEIPVVPCKYHNDAGMLGAYYHFKKMQTAKKDNPAF